MAAWKFSCEQAKHMTSSFRIAGIAFFAAVAGPNVHVILTVKDAGFVAQLTVFLCLIEWVGFEYIGYLILGKGGC